MAKPRKAAKPVFDPLRNQIRMEYETSSDRLRAKLRSPYKWCFCELCDRSTEYSIAVEAQTIFKRTSRDTAEAVPLTEAIRAEALKEADALVKRYEQAMAGHLGPWEPGRMLFEYCDSIDRRGDASIEAFSDQVERRMLIIAWARRGDLLSAVRLPKQLEGVAKPSKLYCEQHNPRRSDEARRAYQRDRSFAAEYDELIRAIWTAQAHQLPTWDIEAHAYVRRVAYRQLQRMKAPTKYISELQTRGALSQAEIARQLGVSRQAVSAAIKRQKKAVAA